MVTFSSSTAASLRASIDSYLQKLGRAPVLSQINPEWIERPYGRKKILSDDGKRIQQIILIEPGRNTGVGASPELLDEYGLVGHPGIFYEHIENEGVVNGNSGSSPSLKYVARSINKTDKPREFLFPTGSSFYSVGTDEAKFGYYHTLENISDQIIQLRLRVVKS